MDLEIKPWDLADYLKSEQDIAGYLAAVIDDEEVPPLLGQTIGLIARIRGGFPGLAHESGIPEQELADAALSRDASALPTVRKLQQAYEHLAATRMVA